MTNKEKVEAIKKWQNCDFVHQLTCGRDQCDGVLVPTEKDVHFEATMQIPHSSTKKRLFLCCPECSYQQKHIPEMVLYMNYEQFDGLQEWINNAKAKQVEGIKMFKTINYLDNIENIAKWMKDYATWAGAKGFVVGLSGGIDSSVVAWLAVHAVGKENVIGVSLPCESREDMGTDAATLAANLGIKFGTIDLVSPAADIFMNVKYNIFNGEELGVMATANTKARLRMTTLYAIANDINYLVAGTGNYSELAIGYFTKYGDGGVDIEPLGDYYKTEVYKMAELMPEIPDSIKTKAPSADLWEGQTDEEEIGMTYAELDNILEAIDCNDYHDIDCDKVAKVKKMINIVGHKNHTPPRYDRSGHNTFPPSDWD